ncbi:hypothetical protein ACOME3_009449 [Neoechinorhynchus agilis]
MFKKTRVSQLIIACSEEGYSISTMVKLPNWLKSAVFAKQSIQIVQHTANNPPPRQIHRGGKVLKHLEFKAQQHSIDGRLGESECDPLFGLFDKRTRSGSVSVRMGI